MCTELIQAFLKLVGVMISVTILRLRKKIKLYFVLLQATLTNRNASQWGLEPDGKALHWRAFQSELQGAVENRSLTLS